MGRHSLGDDQAPDPQGPDSQVEPQRPARPAGPPVIPPGARSGQYPAQQPPGASSGQWAAVPPAEPGNRSGQYPVPPGNRSGHYPVQPQPVRSQPVQQPGARSGEYPVQPGHRTGQYPAQPRPAQQPGTRSGQYPVQPGNRSGQYPVQQPGARSGEYPVQPGHRTGEYPAQPVGHRTGQYPAQPRTERPSARSGQWAVVPLEEPAKPAPAADPVEEIPADTATQPTRRTKPVSPAASASTGGAGSRPGGGKRRRKENTAPASAPAGQLDLGETAGDGGDGGDGKISATGSHRAVGAKASRRRVAGWPIACLVLVALLGLGWLGWGWASGELSSRAEAQADACAEGDAAMRIIVTPSAEVPVRAAADRWNQARTVVHQHCITVTVEAMPSQKVIDALAGRADLSTINGLPAAWLPENGFFIAELTNNKPELIGSPPQSVASARSADYPFLGLSGAGVNDVQKRASQAFRGFLTEPAQQADFAAAGLKAT